MFTSFDRLCKNSVIYCHSLFSYKVRGEVINMNSSDIIWNLLQMYLTEKERNSKKDEKTNEENGECKNLHSQD